MSLTVSPANRRWPVNISHTITPKAQMSARLSTALPRACSGAMYAAVPRIMPAAVPWAASVGECDRLGAEPSRPSGAYGAREAEVEHLGLAVGRELDVGGLEVAVHDALLVRRAEAVRHLARDLERLGDRQRTFSSRSASVSPSTSSSTRNGLPLASSSP